MKKVMNDKEMTFSKLLFVTSVCCFIWTTTDCKQITRRREWFEGNGLSCKYCEKKLFFQRVKPPTARNSNTISNDVIVTVNEPETTRKCVIDEKFLSFTIDTLEMRRRFKCFSFSSIKVKTLVKGLAPAYLRVGGTPQDFLYCTNSVRDHTPEQTFNCTPKFENWATMKPFKVSVYEFEQLMNFAYKNDLDFIFGLNAKIRDNKGSWVANSAKIFIDYVKKYDYVNWQLGNEPNRFIKYGKKAQVSPKQLAEDFRKLRKIAKPGMRKIIGPDISRPGIKSLKFFMNFLRNNPGIDAATYHLYDMHHSEGTFDNFLDPVFLEKLEEEIQWINDIIKLTKSTVDVWVGETGSASGGGAPGLSDKFISGFLYLGKIGLVTEACHKVLIRQSLYGGYYGMLDPITHDPLPDYWTSLLFKKLVGTVVLSSKNSADEYFRTHAYCSKMKEADIVIMIINMNKNIDEILSIKEFENKTIEVYLLTNQKDLQSRDIYLNNKILKVKNNNELPELNPVITTQPVIIPKLSYGFVVVKNVNYKVCNK